MLAALSLQGGGIVDLKRGDQALMISAPTAPFLGSFTMVPFCSRITAGRFDYRGKSVRLAPNFPPERHAIHGFGWQSRWQIGHQEQNACTLVYEHNSGAAETTGWPWAFTVEQHFALSETGLSHSVRVENVSDETMPVGAGFHPYFPLAPSSDVSILCRGELVLDTDGLPITASALGTPNKPADNNGAHINPLANRPWLQHGLDQVYIWRQGSAQIRWPDEPWSLAIEPDPSLPHWVVYAPRKAGFICIEPISHIPDALNILGPETDGRGGLVDLAPGGHWAASIRFITYASS
jgi:aldose 1-epimerase